MCGQAIDSWTVVMVIVYWFLTAFWLLAVGMLIYARFLSDLLVTRKINRLTTGFLVLALLLLIDSIYWSIANTARVEVISCNVAVWLYKPYLIAAVKSLFLVAAFVFMYMFRGRLIGLQRDAEHIYFTRFVEQSSDAIGVIDADGVMCYWNRGAEELYGYERAEVIGKSVKQFLIPKELHASMDATFKRIRQSMKAERFRAPRLRSDGTTIEVDLTISPYRLEDGSFGGFFGIMRALAPVVASRAPQWTGRRLHLVMATNADEQCTVNVHFQNVVSTDDSPITIPVALDYVLETHDDKVVQITGMRSTSSPDPSVILDPPFMGGQSYDGLCKFQTDTRGPVNVMLEFQVSYNFCADARALGERWELDPNKEPLDWYTWFLDRKWDEVLIEFHWPETFRFQGTPWLMWRLRDGEPTAVPSQFYSVVVDDRAWTFQVRNVAPGTTLMPTWRLADPVGPGAVLANV